MRKMLKMQANDYKINHHLIQVMLIRWTNQISSSQNNLNDQLKKLREID